MFGKILKKSGGAKVLCQEEEMFKVLQRECAEIVEKISNLTKLKPPCIEMVEEIRSMKKHYAEDKQALDTEYNIRRAIMMKAYLNRELAIYRREPDKSIIGVAGELKNLRK